MKKKIASLEDAPLHRPLPVAQRPKLNKSKALELLRHSAKGFGVSTEVLLLALVEYFLDLGEVNQLGLLARHFEERSDRLVR